MAQSLPRTHHRPLLTTWMVYGKRGCVLSGWLNWQSRTQCTVESAAEAPPRWVVAEEVIIDHVEGKRLNSVDRCGTAVLGAGHLLSPVAAGGKTRFHGATGCHH
ncbi:MAG: hypothetical protein KGY78_05405 [Anaerolineae bacterium]|nr:hypothetical protein [Anaerolineae bacterium]